MNIVIEKKEKSVVEAKVEFDAVEWKAAQEKAYKKLAKEVTVSGFRKGKAPLDIAKKTINAQKAMTEAIDIILPDGYEQVLKENKLDIIMRPEVRIDSVEEDKLVITYVITVRPEVKLGNYKGINIEKDKVVVTEEEVAAKIAEIQKNSAEISAKESDVLELGDIAVFDFEGFVDGKAFEGGKAEKYELELGSNMFIPGFEDQMVGLKKNQATEINVKFPENYAKELAGKDATFKILVHEINTKKIPEVSDDLALDANIEGVSTLAELKAHLTSDIEKGKSHEADHAAFDKLVDTITSASEVEVPQSLVEEETKNSFENYKKEIEGKGIPFDKYIEIVGTTVEKINEQLSGDVVKNLKAMFVLSAVAEENGIKVTEEDVNGELANIAKQYNMEVEAVKKALESRMSELTNQIFSKKVTDFLKSVNTIA